MRDSDFDRGALLLGTMLLCCIASICFHADAASSTNPSFQGLGFLNKQSPESSATAVSADGQVVVGYSNGMIGNAYREAFRWTTFEGMQGLGIMPGTGTLSEAHGASGDGSVIVGFSQIAQTNTGMRAFRWTAATGMVDLGFVPNSNGSKAFAVSHDGNVVVGISIYLLYERAFRWTEQTGIVLLNPQSGSSCVKSEAKGVSGDGSTVVGHLATSCPSFAKPTIWGLTNIPLSLTQDDGEAFDASFDGTVIVGGYLPNGNQPVFKWTATEGLVPLEMPPGIAGSGGAYAVSDDALTIVGSTGGQAAIWRGGRVRLLHDMLQSMGVTEVEGWYLHSATGVSADGTVIVGHGFNPQGKPEAWRAVVPVGPGSKGSCEGACGGASADRCWCDESCMGFGDCCDDVCTACPGLAICDGMSCLNICGRQAAGGCWCDETCCDFNDCCPDKFTVCGGCNPNAEPRCWNTCHGYCGQQAPGGCYCDELCCSFVDCCPNKFEACGGCDNGSPPILCFDHCGRQSRAGCWCDEACCIFLDCCFDKVGWCGGCNPIITGSCAMFCGHVSPGGGCWCDECCCDMGDCCADKFQICGGCNPTGRGGGPADITNDQLVNVSDLLAVINGWGPCSPIQQNGCVQADIAPHPQGDRKVDLLDLLMVINNWQP